MSSKPPVIHYPIEIPSVQFLFLSEGYSDRLQFLQHVDGVFQAFLAINPFAQIRNKIAAWAHFVPSVDGPVTTAEQNTAFKFFVSDDGKLTTFWPQRVIDAITDILVSVPNVDDPLGFIDGSEMWLGGRIPEESIVCILVNNPDVTSTTIFEWPSDLVDPPAPTLELSYLRPCIFLSSWALSTSSADQYTNPHLAVALVLAKQVGRILSLADETEFAGPEYKVYTETDPLDPGVIEEPPWPNVTAHASLIDVSGQLQIDKLKWKELIPENRMIGISESRHPIAPPGATDAQIQQFYYDVAQLADSSVLMLRHPGHVDPAREMPNSERYVTGPGEELRLSGDINLFEGAAGYRQGLYRSSSECIMRFEGYNTQVGTEVERDAVEFCPVCLEHVTRRLAGFGEFRLDGIKVKPGPGRCRRRIESRVANAVLRYIQQTGEIPEFIDGTLSCVEATTRRFEELFNDVLGWPLSAPVPSTGWYQPQIQLPYRIGPRLFRRNVHRDARRAWAIWNTKLQPKIQSQPEPKPNDRYALSQWNSSRFAGLGAAGAVTYLGFGCITNRQYRNRITINDPELNDGNDIEINFLDITPLTLNDFEHIQPGAILQIWRGTGGTHHERLNNARETFRNILAYIETSRLRREAGLDPENPPTSQQLCGFPDWCGHSLYFVEMHDGQPMIADQYGIRHSLIDSYPSYPFWIAAQWFDATGVKLL